VITRPSVLALTAALALAFAGVARAQPAPEPPPPPPDPTPPAPEPVPAPAPADPPAPADLPAPAGEPLAPYPADPTAAPPPSEPPRPRERKARRIPDLPQILTAPTGRMLPAAYIYTRSSVDTGGGLASELRVGLGDVAEFGVGTTDLIRERRTDDGEAERIAPYVVASFRLGVAEDRLFRHQPAFAIGFRKSFERDHHAAKTRIAELNVVLSKRFGETFVIHAGASFWDAALEDAAGLRTFHDQGRFKDHLRPVGGLEFRPLPDAEILVDLSWAPSFCHAACTDDTFRLDPILSWGVRYLIADWLHIEAGVRVPDIRDVNLLDAQIFGQLTLLTDRLRKVVDSLGGDD
jgi:hypothetical protein